MLMAGLDGIQNKIHPGEAATKDLYDLPEEEASKLFQRLPQALSKRLTHSMQTVDSSLLEAFSLMT